ncbi:MAG: lipoprotein [Acidimicrobiales bacterium]|nr:lipoprotein [Acidimicrobiales bacterium]
MSSQTSSRTRRPALLTLVAVVAVAAGCAGTATARKSAPTTTPAAPTATPLLRTVTAVATGQAKAVPDILVTDVTVHTSGSSAAAVMTDNNTRTQGLIDLLGATGVSPKDVQTTSVNLGPTFNKYGKIDGYAADDAVRITFRDLRTAGVKLDALVGRVGDAVRIGSISLGFGDDTALTSSARADAVRQAVTEARVMAKAAGSDLGKVRTITEVVAGSLVGLPDAVTRGSSASRVPVAPGQQVLSVQVQAVFELA